jgi:acetyltransferase-like isoleucine patch superfamily enzyme
MNNYPIYSGVQWGYQSIIEDYCVIGVPPQGPSEGEIETILGSEAHLRLPTGIYAGNVIGNSFQTGNKVKSRELNRIGNNVSVGTFSVIEPHFEIGNNARIHSQAFVPEFSVLEDAHGLARMWS